MKISKQGLIFKKMLVVGLIIILIISSLIIFGSLGSGDEPNLDQNCNDTLSSPVSFEASDSLSDLKTINIISKSDNSGIPSRCGTRDIRTGNSNLNVTPQGSFSPGYLGDQNKDFYFTVTESYNGEYYDYGTSDAAPEGDYNESLWYVRLTNMEFYYENQQLSPAEWDDQRDEADNNNGVGWFIKGNLDFYSNASSMQMFRFNVGASEIMLGSYELRLTFMYSILINYTATTGRYNFTDFYGDKNITEFESIVFEVRSCLTSDLQVMAVNENNQVINDGRFFANAYNQKMRIFFNEDYPGATLDDVKVTLIPPQFMELYGSTVLDPMNTVSIKSLSINTPFYWRVNINDSVLPGTYSGNDDYGYIYYEYTRGDNQITVTEVLTHTLDFTVDYTPLLSPPVTNGMTNLVPLEHQIVQGASEASLQVNFYNHGNVELFDIWVGLDLSYSFIQPPYYYDAGANDMKTEIIVSDNSIDLLPVGYGDIAFFNLSVYKNLPKGKYLIPVVYTGWYYNNGSLGDPTGVVQTTENDYIMIRSTHDVTPLDTQPHIAVEVLNSQPHITVDQTYSNVYSAGSSNQVIGLTISNYELYGFQNVSISISTGFDSPFEYKGLNYTSPNLKKKVLNTLPSGTQNYPYTTAFSLLANIKTDATGFYSVPVTISGWDVYNEYFEFITSFDVSVIPQLPEFVVVNSLNSEVTPGENFTLWVTIKNVGYSYAYNLEVLYIGSSGYTNTFNPTGDGIFRVSELPPGEQIVLNFNATADANLTIGNNYLVYLKFKFADELGNVYGFNDNSQASFYIRTYSQQLPAITDIFLVTSVRPPEVTPGKIITLSVSVMNIGNFEILDSAATLVSNSNLFKITPTGDPEQGKDNLGSLQPNEKNTVKFTIDVSKSVERGEIYEFQLFIQYEDETGDIKYYDTSDWLPLSIRISEAPEPEEEEDRANWELVSVGVLILVAAIIFVLLLGIMLKRSGIGIVPPAPKEKKSAEELDEKEPPLSQEKEEDVEEDMEEVEEPVKEELESELKAEEIKAKEKVKDTPKPTATALRAPQPAKPTPAAKVTAHAQPIAEPITATSTPKKDTVVTPIKPIEDPSKKNKDDPKGFEDKDKEKKD